ncbi:hypothetical protein G6L97_26755 (plasmid) [Agrobacterium tumefaciens]|uniref:hypothetical protein n=1 Tax=Agrobacterium tumefaciens TaxID=358 RepID=UPI001571B45F|nr:hypothetical protein [Agrobacterium tumefaciens]NSZ87596.1 hypothetical protein [Agrobacterium tumefaciens]WCA72922.1 hypothetical protein G6L97_26755 [Agrobacterium tumefaciens]
MKVGGELVRKYPVVGFPNTKRDSNNFLTICLETDETVVISSSEAPPKAIADLKDARLKASGTISIKVDGKVLESNADNQPGDGPHIWNRRARN